MNMNNSTDSESRLLAINNEIAREMIPAMLYLLVLMLLGTVGNLLVCFVFRFRMRMSTQDYLIVALAAFDLVSCLVAMPTGIADLRYFVTFDNEVACRLLRFVNYYCAIGSVIMLFVIAMDRYMKVCRPCQQQMSREQVKRSLLLVLLLTLVLSSPSAALYGIRIVQVEGLSVAGHDCYVSDSLRDSVFPLIYNVFLLAFIFMVLGLLTAMYVLIWRQLKRRSTLAVRGPNTSNTTNTSKTSNTSNTSRTPALLVPDKSQTPASSETESAQKQTTSQVRTRPERSSEHTPGGANYRDGVQTERCSESLDRNHIHHGEDTSLKLRETDREGAIFTRSAGGGRGDDSRHEDDESPPPRSSETDEGDPLHSAETDKGQGSTHVNGRSSFLASRPPATSETDDVSTTTALETSVTCTVRPGVVVGGVRVSQSEARCRKTVVIAMTITGVFFLSFLPHLALMVIDAVDEDFERDLRGAGRVLFNIFLRSYFVNSVANPFIYAALNLRFRKECQRLFRRFQSCWATLPH